MPISKYMCNSPVNLAIETMNSTHSYLVYLASTLTYRNSYNLLPISCMWYWSTRQKCGVWANLDLHVLLVY